MSSSKRCVILIHYIGNPIIYLAKTQKVANNYSFGIATVYCKHLKVKNKELEQMWKEIMRIETCSSNVKKMSGD